MSTKLNDVTEMLINRNLPADTKPAEEVETIGQKVSEEETLIGEDAEEEQEEVLETDEEEDDPDDQEEETQEDEDDAEYLEFDDTTLVEVIVDGEAKEVPLSDLRNAYSGNAAIEKRLQEASELRNEQRSVRDQALQEAETVKNATIAVLEHVSSELTTPLVSEPDPALRNSNPAQYLRHLEAYQKDQSRIAKHEEQLKTLFGEQAKKLAEVKENNRKQQLILLGEKLPSIKNEKTREQASADILEAAKHYGFSEQEVNSFADHRLYVMAHDAQQYRKLKSTPRTGDMEERKPGKRRVLRSGKTKPRAAAASQKKAIDAARKQAQTTGKHQDVAAYLATRNLKG